MTWVNDQRFETGAEHPLEVARQRIDRPLLRRREMRHPPIIAAGYNQLFHGPSDVHDRLLRRWNGTAQPARRAEDESLAERERGRHDVRQRRQLRHAARPAWRAPTG